MMLNFDLTLTQSIELTGADNGVTSIEFTNFGYSVTDLALIELSAGKYLINGAVPGGVTASVSGDYSQNGGGPVDVTRAARVTGTCDITGDTVVCGLIFRANGFDLPVGGESGLADYCWTVRGPQPKGGNRRAA